jgi:hypothetical protein
MEKIKRLIILLAIPAFCLVAGSHFSIAAEAPQGSQKDTATIVAYYFHGNFRCPNCLTIEQYSKETIEKYFTEQLKNGKLTFTVINIDHPENEHFIKDYQLYTRSLILAEFKNGKQVRWTNLEKVWNYINNRDAFYNYVKTEIEKYLKSM